MAARRSARRAKSKRQDAGTRATGKTPAAGKQKGEQGEQKEGEDEEKAPTSWVLHRFSASSHHFNRVCTLAALLVAVCGVAEHIQPVPYGKFGGASQNLLSIGLPAQIGWWLMELPCSAFFAYQFFAVGGPQASRPVPRFFAFLFCCHYLYRGWLFPYMLRPSSSGLKNFDVTVALGSWGVTLLHAYLNARWYAEHGTHLAGGVNFGGKEKKNGSKKKRVEDSSNDDFAWTKDVRFRVGIALYYAGFALTIYHDHLMRELRPCPGGARYCIPHGGLYEYVTMGGYTSELLAWLGFAIASWGPNGLFIFLVSLGNLVPRAATSHKWYLDTFPEYAALGRAKLIPGVW